MASLDADGMTNELDELNVDHRIGQSWIALGMPDKALTAYGDALATLADASKKWPRNKTGWSQTFVFIKTTIGAILKNLKTSCQTRWRRISKPEIDKKNWSRRPPPI